MRSALAKKQQWTAEDYLTWERKQPDKHEYFQGEVFAMTGASREHNLLHTNVIRLLGNALLDQPCELYPSEMRVHVPATGLYTYPDVTVVCEEPRFQDTTFDTLLNPTVMFEILSDSTEAYDRGEKFENYRSLDSLRDYVLISQDRALVEHYARQTSGTWLLSTLRAGGVLRLASIDCVLAVDEIYRKVPLARLSS